VTTMFQVTLILVTYKHVTWNMLWFKAVFAKIWFTQEKFNKRLPLLLFVGHCMCITYYMSVLIEILNLPNNDNRIPESTKQETHYSKAQT